jgi:cytochrome c
MLRPALALATVLGLAATPAFAADGAKLFQLQCKTCHADKSTVMAPSLQGVAGRGIAALADFKYSTGLKAKGGTWTVANLDAFLAAPAKFAPGTRMPIAVANPADRTALIGYLKTLK